MTELRRHFFEIIQSIKKRMFFSEFLVHDAAVNWGQSFFSQRPIAKITLTPINGLRSTAAKSHNGIKTEQLIFNPTNRPHTRRDEGFTYLGLIILIAIIGIISAASLQMGSLLERRAAEQELLDIGAEFREALISYAAATPVGQASMPQSLDDLLKDARYPSPRRHLRKLYADPITGREEWGTITAPSAAGVGIIGVHSLSEAIPIKVGNFDAPFQDFQGKTSYRDWHFIVAAPALPPIMPKPPAASAAKK